MHVVFEFRGVTPSNARLTAAASAANQAIMPGGVTGKATGAREPGGTHPAVI